MWQKHLGARRQTGESKTSTSWTLELRQFGWGLLYDAVHCRDITVPHSHEDSWVSSKVWDHIMAKTFMMSQCSFFGSQNLERVKFSLVNSFSIWEGGRQTHRQIKETMTNNFSWGNQLPNNQSITEPVSWVWWDCACSSHHQKVAGQAGRLWRQRPPRFRALWMDTLRVFCCCQRWPCSTSLRGSKSCSLTWFPAVSAITLLKIPCKNGTDKNENIEVLTADCLSLPLRSHDSWGRQ